MVGFWSSLSSDISEVDNQQGSCGRSLSILSAVSHGETSWRDHIICVSVLPYVFVKPCKVQSTQHNTMPWGAKPGPSGCKKMRPRRRVNTNMLSLLMSLAGVAPATKNTAQLFPVLASEGRPRERDVSVATPVCCRHH